MTKAFWNRTVSYFNTKVGSEDFHEGIADNMLIAWPVMVNFVKKVSQQKKVKILDFGCGPGDLCNLLLRNGFDVTGIDISEEMIRVAKEKYGEKIDFYIGEAKDIERITKQKGKFDVIISSMVFQFIENIEETIVSLTQSISKNGAICFAVFAQNWLQDCIDTKSPLHKLPPNATGVNEVLIELLPGESIKSFNRSEQTYTKIFKKLGFKKIMEEYPDFTQDWIDKYQDSDPVNMPKFMILGFQRN